MTIHATGPRAANARQPGRPPLARRIVGWGSAMPERAVTSAEVARLVAERSDWAPDPAELVTATGVTKRRWADDGVRPSDLAVTAARRALDRAGTAATDVGVLIFASISVDVFEPAVANIVQEKLGATEAAVFDIRAGANGVLYALHSVAAMADRRPVLVTTGEVLSRHIRTRFGSAEDLRRGLFGLARGDAGAALLLDAGGAVDGIPSLGRFVTQGRHWRAAYVAAGGAWRGSDLSEGDVKVDLDEFGRCAMEVLPPLLGDVVTGRGWEAEELLVVSNLPETRAAAVVDRAGLARARVATSMTTCGDTGAAAIPLALCQAADDWLPAGARVVLLGAASGFGGAAVPLVW